MAAERANTSSTFAARETGRDALALFDTERRRIGQDLHDGIGQHLTGIHLMTKTLERRLQDKNNPEADFARSIVNLVDETIHQVRRVVAGMAPPEVEHQDAASALQTLCRRIEGMYQIECSFFSQLQTEITNKDVIKNLYFIAGESIHNAIRHGKADQIKATLTGTDVYGEMTISNNGSFAGKSFTGQPGIGLATMQFRAQALNGWLRLQPEENHSVSVICHFSLADSQED
jgi:signal transduction histidine kinase